MSNALNERVKELSEIERKAVLALSKIPVSFEELSVSAGVPIDSIRRASAWLKEKGFAIVLEEESEGYSLSSYGEKALSKGMPENIFLEALSRIGGKATFAELEKESGLSKQEFMAALGINKRKVFVIISGGKIEETGVAKEQESFSEQNFLRDIADGKKIKPEVLLELSKRGLVEKKKLISRTIKISPAGEEAKEILLTQNVSRTYDVSAPVPQIFLGKKAPYIQFLQQIRQKLVTLGFKEMPTTLAVTEFYHFDVLFQPQNHPARAWTDTYQLKNPKKGALPKKEMVDAIRAAHENGGVSGSKGWGYDWSADIAERLMPSAHGTAHSARQLISGVKSPGKYFAIARCFRPDVLDATHLMEFNQMEGFIIGEGLNFKHLLGMLKDFAIEIAGAQEVKFFPDYYPFTEPSVQLSAKHPELGWVEFGGAGMFRPEMLDNIGIKGEAIAWGLGIDRLAMFKLGINDIRYLFSDDLSYYRNAKGVLI
ncbi:MAG: phenylalanine--tRNA ligase subunit alpha [Candidatus Diapherotrites archaeon]|nr:phenylalanine--tRNA ligase subunit alpha [Candidatus Diapherotrites archaeon]